MHDIDNLNEAQLVDLYNRKTVTVITDAGMQWTVAPCFCAK